MRSYLDAGFFHNDPQIYYFQYCVPRFTREQDDQYRARVRAKKVPFRWDRRFGDNVVWDLNRIRGWVQVRTTDPKRRLKYWVFVDRGAIKQVRKVSRRS